MTTFEFLVALARDAGMPFAVALIGVAAAFTAPIIVIASQRSADRRARLQANRDVDLKKIEASVRNGSVALTRTPEPPDY